MTLFSDRDERVLENLRIINSRFLRKKKEPVRGERITPPGGGSAPTVVFAPSNSSTYSKARADFILAGVQDLTRIEAILDAIDLEVGGLRVVITEGLVQHSMAGATTHALRLKGQTTILGMGQFATEIALTPGDPAVANLAVVQTNGNSGAIYDLTMSAVTIDTNPPHLIRTTDSMSLEHLYLLHAPQDAISCGSGSNLVTLKHVWIQGAGRDGLANTSSNHVHAHSVKSVQAGRHNFYSDNGGGTMVGCTSEAATENGFHLLGHNGKLIGCKSEGDTLDGIFADSCEEYHIVASQVLSPGAHGIHLVDSSNGIVSDNLVTDAGADADDTFDCIALEGDSNSNSVQGNRVFAGGNTPRYGINVIDSTCDGNVVNGNVAGPVGDFGTGAYNDAGTGTQGANFTV